MCAPLCASVCTCAAFIGKPMSQLLALGTEVGCGSIEGLDTSNLGPLVIPLPVSSEPPWLH